MQRRGRERNRDDADRRWSLRQETEESGDADEQAEPGRGDRLLLGAETGLRWLVQTVALLLWVPFGFVFWLPFLLRRTVTYVFAVLYAGLTGGDTDEASQRWEDAIAFYRLGFQRIIHAFRDEEEDRQSGLGRGDRASGSRIGRFVRELVWAAAVWGTVLWLSGLWPEAPEVVRSATLRGWETVHGWGEQLLSR